MAHGKNAQIREMALRGFEIHWRGQRKILMSDTPENRVIARRLRRAAEKRETLREINEFRCGGSR